MSGLAEEIKSLGFKSGAGIAGFSPIFTSIYLISIKNKI